MAQTAAHVVDRVLPEVPVRQWVLTLPYPLRFLLARDPALTSLVRRKFLRAIFAFHARRARALGVPGGRSGAVCALQRFGSSLNLNPHFHALVIEGVYATPAPFLPPTFHELPAPTPDELARMLDSVRRVVLRHLDRVGLLDPPTGRLGPEESADEPPLLSWFDGASIRDEALFEGPATPSPRHLGVLRPDASVRPRAETREDELCVFRSGFTLHAATRADAHDRERLEHLVRYLLRPPLAGTRLSIDDRSRVQLALRKPFRDGTTHLAFEPLARLASLVPRPRSHLFTYHGVLAPGSSWRDGVVPATSEPQAATSPSPAIAVSLPTALALRCPTRPRT